MATRTADKRSSLATAERLNPWAAALKRALANDAEEPPPGWIRREQAFKLLGYRTYNGGKKAWRRMVTQGIIEVKHFRQPVGNRVMPVPFYRLASDPKTP
jgi:hypothetical protein